VLWLLVLSLCAAVPACADQAKKEQPKQTTKDQVDEGKDDQDPHKALIGKPAPDFKGEFSLNGKPIKLSDLKDKVVLLDFWAVWCGPCVATFPHLREWHNEYKDKGLEIVGVTTYFKSVAFNAKSGKLEEAQQDLSKEQEQKMLTDFAAYHKLEYHLTVLPEKENDKVTEDYKVEGIPQAVLIDRKGVVRMIKVGAEKENANDLAKMIKQLIGENAK
jgi:thiol-disulfide isomerase/thioredoxin